MPKKTGRPSKYSERLAAAICSEIVQGKSLRTICAKPKMPVCSTVFLWLNEHKFFSEQYARAREAATDAMVEEMLDIADDGANDWTEVSGKPKVNNEAVQRSRLRVDTRKWIVSKLKPKKYGDRIQQDVTGMDNAPVAPIINVTLTREGD